MKYVIFVKKLRRDKYLQNGHSRRFCAAGVMFSK